MSRSIRDTLQVTHDNLEGVPINRVSTPPLNVLCLRSPSVTLGNSDVRTLSRPLIGQYVTILASHWSVVITRVSVSLLNTGAAPLSSTYHEIYGGNYSNRNP